MALDPQLVTAAATIAAGVTMVYAGQRKKMFESKRGSRRCPSCGCVIVGRTCDRH